MTEARVEPHRPIGVSELTRYLKYLVEQDELLAALSVEGEVTELSRSPAGHVYFTLRDARSQVTCVLFRREASTHRPEVDALEKGVSVVVHGFLTVYEPRGTCQIYVERVVIRGTGAIRQRFEQLRVKLDAEGLFTQERKRELPAFPRKLALVTSPQSQAYHDVLHRIRRQYPFVTIIEAGATVQGEGAADEMAMAIDIVNRLTDADVILLVRGGGSPEDLAAFNEERLARAIFASRIPVVTGIGHETDNAIADLVADRRAATPSLAAAEAVPDVEALVQRVRHLHGQASQLTYSRIRAERRRFEGAGRQLLQLSPLNRLRTQRRALHSLSVATERAMRAVLRDKRARQVGLTGQVRALDPLAILARGYALLTDVETGRVIRRVEEAAPGRRLSARVADGEFAVKVEER